MNYDFFANKDDKIEVLEFILTKTDLRIFDLYSELECEIKEYKKIEDFKPKFELQNNTGN